jgi:hypothetical protein
MTLREIFKGFQSIVVQEDILHFLEGLMTYRRDYFRVPAEFNTKVFPYSSRFNLQVVHNPHYVNVMRNLFITHYLRPTQKTPEQWYPPVL